MVRGCFVVLAAVVLLNVPGAAAQDCAGGVLEIPLRVTGDRITALPEHELVALGANACVRWTVNPPSSILRVRFRSSEPGYPTMPLYTPVRVADACTRSGGATCTVVASDLPRGVLSYAVDVRTPIPLDISYYGRIINCPTPPWCEEEIRRIMRDHQSRIARCTRVRCAASSRAIAMREIRAAIDARARR
ncbi:MAG TPA: hypothetical protein VFT12_13400 [Thermoanaerobaculia bacterium]|nr:hypothetical protein [Thermoanaerobaculia bacterium]